MKGFCNVCQAMPDLQTEINILADYYEKVLERVLNGQTGLQNEAKTEDTRNRQSTSGTNVRTEERSNGNSVRNLGSESEISEDEINPDDELYQECSQVLA